MGPLQSCGVRAHVPQYPLLHLCGPGESGKPDSKLPIFSLQLKEGCLFYIFISTTECLPQPARTVKGWAVLMLSMLLPCCAWVLESKTPRLVAAIGHITLLCPWGQGDSIFKAFCHSPSSTSR